MKKILKIFFLAFLLHTLWTATSIWLYKDSYQPAQKADVALVLGSYVIKDTPSAIFKERINHGIWLYQNGKAKKLMFTGGKGDSVNLAEALAARKYALKKGVPEEDILTEAASVSTYENLKFSTPIMMQNNIETIIVVTSPFHMKRAMVMAKDLGLKASSSSSKKKKPDSFVPKVMFILLEVPKYQLYQLKHVADFLL